MTEYELLRVIRFLRRIRKPYVCLLAPDEPDASWCIVTHLIESEINSQPVTISTLTDVSELPYATALRRVHRMIDDGSILKQPRTSKTFTLHPSPELKARFEIYARQVKMLLAETFGRADAGEDENDFYFGGMAERKMSPAAPIAGDRLRFLLHDDNYFASMRNMWVDFRSNQATRCDFEMRVLPDLHARLLVNAEAAVSSFDVVTVNMPWLAEFASRGALLPLDRYIQPAVLQPNDYQPMVWQTGSWRAEQFGVPIYVTVELLAARRDVLEQAGLPPPRRFDEVIEVARSFHAPARERYGVVWNAARGMPIAHSFMFFLGCCNGEILGRGQTGEAIEIDGLPGRAVLDYMHRLVEVSPPDVLDMEWSRGLDLFLRGRSALSYIWTMRAARFEYDIHSAVKRKVKYLPHAAGPSGTNMTPMGGFLLAVPANLPQERVRRAFAAIASMASPDAMRAHAKNGLPVVPRFSVAADPEVAAGSPLIQVVDGLAKRGLITTLQRPPVPQYSAIEGILGDLIHRALRRDCTDAAALAQAQQAVEALMAGSRSAAQAVLA